MNLNGKIYKKYLSPLDLKDGFIDMSHGAGGRAMAGLIDEVFVKILDNKLLAQKNDWASFQAPNGRMVMSTDGFVVSPIFFPGGNIGSLAVHGTVNDVCMSGAVPLYLSASFIIEEGFSLSELVTIVESMADAARKAEVLVVTGDTKIVERGKGDGVYITTTGVGVIQDERVNIAGSNVEAGDKIIVSGTLGDHGVAVMSQRNNLDFQTSILSDSAALNDLVSKMVKEVPQIHCLRDPTRGGLAATLNEIATASEVGIIINESVIPVDPQVEAISEMLGIDPLYIANEGKLVAFCSPSEADQLLNVIRTHPLGKDAAIIGEVQESKGQEHHQEHREHHIVRMKTLFGGEKIVNYLTSESLPRIC